MLPKTDATERLWRDYADATRLAPDADYVVVALRRAMDPLLSSQLAELVRTGGKTATVSLARDYGAATEDLPRVGDHVVLTDGNLQPRCIWRTTEIVVKPFGAVDAAFARDEGEDDRSVAAWRLRQLAYFGHQAKEEGFALHEDIATVFERFEVVWPRA